MRNPILDVIKKAEATKDAYFANDAAQVTRAAVLAAVKTLAEVFPEVGDLLAGEEIELRSTTTTVTKLQLKRKDEV